MIPSRVSLVVSEPETEGRESKGRLPESALTCRSPIPRPPEVSV